MKAISTKISSLLILMLIAISCIDFIEEIEPDAEIQGSWSQETETAAGTERLVFNFNSDNTFSSSTQICTDVTCTTEAGSNATWSVIGSTITVSFEGINVSKTYTVLEESGSRLILQEGSNIFAFNRT